MAPMAAAQEALVRAMTAGGPLPDGFDAAAVGAAARGILYKRAGEVARAWALPGGLVRTPWKRAFADWAAQRPTRGSLRDGWDFARVHRGELSEEAVRELALVEARWCNDGHGGPRRRRMAVRRVPHGVAVQVSGRMWIFGRGAGNRPSRKSRGGARERTMV